MRRLTLLVVVAALLAGCGSARPPGPPTPTPSPTVSATPTPSPSPTPTPARCDLWAAPGGSDSAAGTQAAPLATPQALADRLAAGQIGCLRGGTYVERGNLLLQFRHGGAPGAPLTIRSAPGERATLRGIVYVPVGSDHVVLSGLTFDARHPDGSVSVGIQILGSDAVIEGSEISNDRSTTSCLLLGAEAGARASGTVIRDNVFHDCGNTSDGMLDHAIYVEAADGTRITDNVFVRTAGWAVHLYPDARGTLVTGNVMWDGGGGVVFAGDGAYASSGNRVVGNVIGGSRRRPELVSSWGGRIGRGNVAAGNCLLPGLAASERPPEGFAARGNTVVRPATAAAAARCPGRLGRLAGAALGS